MVKVEDCTDSGSSSEVEILDQKTLLDASSDLKPSFVPDVANETSCPSSSSGHLKSYFIGMGFSPTLVDKVFEENGEGDTEFLLEALIKLSSSGHEAPNSLDDFSRTVKEEADSPLDFELDDGIHNQYPNEPSMQDGDKRSYLLMMKFTEEEVDLAINQLGEGAPLPELVDFIVTAQTGANDIGGSENDLRKDQENISETLFDVMDRTQYLLQMGFTEDEVSHAIDKFGAEVCISELVYSIFAKRLCHRVGKEEDQTNDGTDIKTESDYLDHAAEELKCCYSKRETRETTASSSNSEFYDYEEKVRVKRSKGAIVDDEPSFHHGAKQNVKCEAAWPSEPNPFRNFKEMPDPTFIKKEDPEQLMPNINCNSRGSVSRPPYFFYGNVVDVSRETWRRLSEFLYGTQPEFVNCQYFSAYMRKEGYMHNFPKGRRFHMLPQPPMTLQEAFPQTKRWWPSWDTRKQLSCINTDTKVISQVCEQLGKMMMNSQGIISDEQKMNVLHQCKTFNLIWAGQYKLSPIEPNHVERILGYPRHHTQILGLQPDERFWVLKHSFQIDALGFYLSTLKAEYPDGIRVLSVYSGIGGAEIALHRLGINLKCVVSVEASDVNRKIVRRWWENTQQSGELIQIAGIEKLATRMLEGFVQKFGGFDLIIGGNPGTYLSGGSNVSSSMGMDQNLYFEFVRVLQRVRSIMGRNN
ncbi:DNA (cytosine-5)-methyltransferase DRM2 [Canna indica]|uniref:DNA (Cytosine-5)-methyltransferase DRM2 n=1 Tax=Canna indica TaxID=4628 RepID=A0AAQ3KDD9_9LILI|nr:DNA (cytosine-5)-methyltransferase DRM2 [Canna indica]